jgi:hypothetical protein
LFQKFALYKIWDGFSPDTLGNSLDRLPPDAVDVLDGKISVRHRGYSLNGMLPDAGDDLDGRIPAKN